MSKSRRLRVEEYVPAAAFLMTSFVRDRAEMQTRFMEFTPQYQTDFATKLAEVQVLEQSLQLTAHQKQVTAALYVVSDTLNKELNFLSFHFKRANLDTAILTKVKKDLARHNIEGACQKLGGLIQYITAEHVLLESKGMAAGFPAELTATKTELEAKNAMQNAIMDTKGQLTENNTIQYKLLYSFVSTITSAGKVMYDGFGKEDEYTITKIIGRMRAGKTAAVESPVI